MSSQIAGHRHNPDRHSTDYYATDPADNTMTTSAVIMAAYEFVNEHADRELVRWVHPTVSPACDKFGEHPAVYIHLRRQGNRQALLVIKQTGDELSLCQTWDSKWGWHHYHASVPLADPKCFEKLLAALHAKAAVLLGKDESAGNGNRREPEQIAGQPTTIELNDPDALDHLADALRTHGITYKPPRPADDGRDGPEWELPPWEFA